MPEYYPNAVYTRLALETCYDQGDIVTASIIINRCDLTTEELAAHIRGILLASDYSPDNVDAILVQ